MNIILIFFNYKKTTKYNTITPNFRKLIVEIRYKKMIIFILTYTKSHKQINR